MLQNLPFDILVEILSYLHPLEFLPFTALCRSLRVAITSDIMFRPIVKPLLLHTLVKSPSTKNKRSDVLFTIDTQGPCQVIWHSDCRSLMWYYLYRLFYGTFICQTCGLRGGVYGCLLMEDKKNCFPKRSICALCASKLRYHVNRYNNYSLDLIKVKKELRDSRWEDAKNLMITKTLAKDWFKLSEEQLKSLPRKQMANPNRLISRNMRRSGVIPSSCIMSLFYCYDLMEEAFKVHGDKCGGFLIKSNKRRWKNIMRNDEWLRRRINSISAFTICNVSIAPPISPPDGNSESYETDSDSVIFIDLAPSDESEHEFTMLPTDRHVWLIEE